MLRRLICGSYFFPSKLKTNSNRGISNVDESKANTRDWVLKNEKSTYEAVVKLNFIARHTTDFDFDFSIHSSRLTKHKLCGYRKMRFNAS